MVDILERILLHTPDWKEIRKWRAHNTKQPLSKIQEQNTLFENKIYIKEIVMNCEEFALYRFDNNIQMLVYRPGEDTVRGLGYVALYSNNELVAYYNESNNSMVYTQESFRDELRDRFRQVREDAMQDKSLQIEIFKIATSKSDFLIRYLSREKQVGWKQGDVNSQEYIPKNLFNILPDMMMLFK